MDVMTIWFTHTAATLRKGGRVRSVALPGGGRAAVTYQSDEDGNRYAFVPFAVGVDGVSAEIEDDTYGTLFGFRFYLAGF
jgi:hypothetical protein